MTDRLVTRKQINEMYGFSYVPETYRRWERDKILFKIQVTFVSRAYYRLSNVIAVFGPVPTEV